MKRSTRIAGAGVCLGLGLLALAPAARAVEPGTVVHPADIRTALFGSCFPTPSEGWVGGELGRVYKTADAGASWVRQEPSGTDPLFSIACADGKHAWASSYHGRVHATVDGGATWSVQKTPVDRNLFQVVFPTAMRGTAVGDYSSIVHTEDGGKTWTKIELPDDFKLPDSALDSGVDPHDAILYGLTFVDENHGFASGEFGVLLETKDGGRSWRQLTSPVESTLFGVRFENADKGFAVGLDATILATTDGGQTWKQIPGPHKEQAYYDVAVEGSNGWIAGNQGILLQTTDGGVTWKSFPVPIKFASEWFRSVSLFPEGGFVVGGNGLIYKTSGGEAKLLRDVQQAGGGL